MTALHRLKQEANRELDALQVGAPLRRQFQDALEEVVACRDDLMTREVLRG